MDGSAQVKRNIVRDEEVRQWRGRLSLGPYRVFFLSFLVTEFLFFFQIPFGLTDLIDRDPVRFGLDRVVWFASPEAVILFNESGGLPGFCFFLPSFSFVVVRRAIYGRRKSPSGCVYFYILKTKKKKRQNVTEFHSWPMAIFDRSPRGWLGRACYRV